MGKKEKEDRILEEIKHHNKVLMEHVEHQVKTVAEQHGFIVRKLEQHDGQFEKIGQKLEEHDGQFRKIDQRFDTVEMAVMENSRQIKGLKTGQEELKAGQERLEQRLGNVEHKLDTTLSDHEGRIKKVEEKVGT